MDKPQVTGQLFPDTAAITAALEQSTRDALLRRQADAPDTIADIPLPPDPVERSKARGIGFGVDLVRAIIDGRKTQTRRLVRPPPGDVPPNPEDCPAARPGELIYVREPWLRTHDAVGSVRIEYAADEPPATGRRFRPAMYMARDAARLWLRVTDVRAERLQAIADADVLAEGLPPGQSLASVWDGFYTAPGDRYADDPWVWVIAFAMEPSPPVATTGGTFR